MKKLAYFFIVIVAVSDVFVVHSLSANDEQIKAEQLAEWREAYQDQIADFENQLKESI